MENLRMNDEFIKLLDFKVLDLPARVVVPDIRYYFSGIVRQIGVDLHLVVERISAALVYPLHAAAVHVEDLESGRGAVDADLAAPPRSAESCNVDFCDVVADLLVVGSVHMAGKNQSPVRLEHLVQSSFVAKVVQHYVCSECVAVRLVQSGRNVH